MSNKGKKQKTVAPISGQSSLNVFFKRMEKKGGPEKETEPRKTMELQSAITKTSIKCPSLAEFKNYQDWVQNKEVKVIETNPEDTTPAKGRGGLRSARKEKDS